MYVCVYTYIYIYIHICLFIIIVCYSISSISYYIIVDRRWYLVLQASIHVRIWRLAGSIRFDSIRGFRFDCCPFLQIWAIRACPETTGKRKARDPLGIVPV